MSIQLSNGVNTGHGNGLAVLHVEQVVVTDVQTLGQNVAQADHDGSGVVSADAGDMDIQGDQSLALALGHIGVRSGLLGDGQNQLLHTVFQHCALGHGGGNVAIGHGSVLGQNVVLSIHVHNDLHLQTVALGVVAGAEDVLGSPTHHPSGVGGDHLTDRGQLRLTILACGSIDSLNDLAQGGFLLSAVQGDLLIAQIQGNESVAADGSGRTHGIERIVALTQNVAQTQSHAGFFQSVGTGVSLMCVVVCPQLIAVADHSVLHSLVAAELGSVAQGNLRGLQADRCDGSIVTVERVAAVLADGHIALGLCGLNGSGYIAIGGHRAVIALVIIGSRVDRSQGYALGYGHVGQVATVQVHNDACVLYTTFSASARTRTI